MNECCKVDRFRNVLLHPPVNLYSANLRIHASTRLCACACASTHFYVYTTVTVNSTQTRPRYINAQRIYKFKSPPVTYDFDLNQFLNASDFSSITLTLTIVNNLERLSGGLFVVTYSTNSLRRDYDWPWSVFDQKQVFGPRTVKSQLIWIKFCTHLLLCNTLMT